MSALSLSNNICKLSKIHTRVPVHHQHQDYQTIINCKNTNIYQKYLQSFYSKKRRSKNEIPIHIRAAIAIHTTTLKMLANNEIIDHNLNIAVLLNAHRKKIKQQPLHLREEYIRRIKRGYEDMYIPENATILHSSNIYNEKSKSFEFPVELSASHSKITCLDILQCTEHSNNTKIKKISITPSANEENTTINEYRKHSLNSPLTPDSPTPENCTPLTDYDDNYNFDYCKEIAENVPSTHIMNHHSYSLSIPSSTLIPPGNPVFSQSQSSSSLYSSYIPSKPRLNRTLSTSAMDNMGNVPTAHVRDSYSDTLTQQQYIVQQQLAYQQQQRLLYDRQIQYQQQFQPQYQSQIPTGYYYGYY